jgi:hypothetical protein
MADSSSSLLPVDFTNSIAISNLCTIAVSGNGIPTGRDFVGNLSRKDIADRAILVHDTKRFAVNLDDTGNGCSAGKKLANC